MWVHSKNADASREDDYKLVAVSDSGVFRRKVAAQMERRPVAGDGIRLLSDVP